MRLGCRALAALALALLLSGCSRKAATIDVSPKKLRIYGLENIQRLTATLRDKKGNALEEGTVSWSISKEDVATIDANGRLVSKGEGKAIVTVTFEKLSTQVPVEVVDAATIEVLPLSARLLGPPGTQLAMQASVKSSKDQPVATAVVWSSSDEKVATVTSEGVVTSVAPGTATILAKLGDLQAASEIAVDLRNVTRLEIRPATALVRVGETQRFEVIGYGADGKPFEGFAVSFRSSDPAVAKIDATGMTNGLAPGTTTIRASLGALSVEATLLVN